MKWRWWFGDAAGIATYSYGPKVLAKLSRSQFLTFSQGISALKGHRGNKNLTEELALILGDRTEGFFQDVIRESTRIRVANELEVLRYPEMCEDNIGTICDVEGQHHLDAGLKRGKGVILMIGHFGANQMIMPALGYRGYSVNQLSAPPTVWADILPDRATKMWRKKLSVRWGLEQTLPVKHINVFKFLRPAFGCLRANEILGLAFDGGGGTEWLKVDFMGRHMNISSQPFQLWNKTKSTLLPTVVLRQSWQEKHQVIITPALDWEDHPDGLQHNAQRYVDWFSGWVQQFPCHYLQFLSMRRQVRGTDVQPFFDDYPSIKNALDSEAALARLREAGNQT
jgi:phosphatidylinositol dimannoside acyltransferase